MAANIAKDMWKFWLASWGASMEAARLTAAANETILRRVMMAQSGLLNGDQKTMMEMYRMSAEKPPAFMKSTEAYMKTLRRAAEANAKRLRR